MRKKSKAILSISDDRKKLIFLLFLHYLLYYLGQLGVKIWNLEFGIYKSREVCYDGFYRRYQFGTSQFLSLGTVQRLVTVQK